MPLLSDFRGVVAVGVDALQYGGRRRRRVAFVGVCGAPGCFVLLLLWCVAGCRWCRHRRDCCCWCGIIVVVGVVVVGVVVVVVGIVVASPLLEPAYLFVWLSVCVCSGLGCCRCAVSIDCGFCWPCAAARSSCRVWSVCRRLLVVQLLLFTIFFPTPSSTRVSAKLTALIRDTAALSCFAGVASVGAVVVVVVAAVCFHLGVALWWVFLLLLPLRVAVDAVVDV